jgi:glutaconate CoA-transferase subunit B
MFRYWLQGGRITVGFLGAAQLDKFGNINTTVVGDYYHPKVRLPGGGGAPEIGFVETIDFFTSMGHGKGGDDRARHGVTTRGPTRLVTDLAVWEPDPHSREFTVVSLHPGVARSTVEDTVGWPVKFAEDVTETLPPRAEELKVLRDLHTRTTAAHEGDAKSANGGPDHG